MPFLQLKTSVSQPAVLLPIPDDGKIHTIPMDLGLAEEHRLHVQLGDHTPQHLAASASATSAAAATAGQKRRRRSSRLRANEANDNNNEQLLLTIRYTPPTTQQDRKATRSVQRYHTRTIRQIETAFRNAKQARLELEAAPETTKTDLVAAGLEIHLLTKELNRRHNIEKLYFDQTTTDKWFVVPKCTPTRLVGVPGSPIVCLFGGGNIVDATSSDEVKTVPRSVPVAPDPIEGKFVKEIASDRQPGFVACSEGRVYVTHWRNNISVLDVKSGAVVEEWTISGVGMLTAVAVYGEHMFVADASKHCIRVLDMEGKQERQFGTEGSATGEFNRPRGAVIAGNLLYICDPGNHRVQVFGLDGTWVRSWGSQGTGEGQFDDPSGITVHDDEVYVTDSGNHRVQVFGLDGTFRRMWGSKGAGDGEMNYPREVIVHGELVYMIDGSNHRVQSFKAADGEFVGSWGTYGSAAGQFKFPWGLCVDDKDRLWVGDSLNKRLQLFR